MGSVDDFMARQAGRYGTQASQPKDDNNFGCLVILCILFPPLILVLLVIYLVRK